MRTLCETMMSITLTQLSENIFKFKQFTAAPSLYTLTIVYFVTVKRTIVHGILFYDRSHLEMLNVTRRKI